MQNENEPKGLSADGAARDFAALALDLHASGAGGSETGYEPDVLSNAMAPHLVAADTPAVGQGAPDTRHEVARIDAAVIAATVVGFRQTRESLRDFQRAGGSRKAWLQDALAKASQQDGAGRTSSYISRIDDELGRATEQARACITRLDGGIDQNQNLHGFIAEQEHVNTFNIDAATKDVSARAHRLDSRELNSPDIEVVENGATTQKLQSKYGKTGEHTADALKDGDYADQRHLVPGEQKDQIPGSTDRIKHGDAESKPFSHEEAKQRQEQAQTEGESKEYDWQDVALKAAAKQVLKKSLLAGALAIALQGARIGARRGWKALNDEENRPIREDWDEFVEAALKSGVQAFGTTALIGAVVIAARNGWLGAALRNVDAGPIAIAVMLAIENAKVLYEVSQGEMTFAEASAAIVETNFVAIAMIAGGYAGGVAGGAIGLVFGPVGASIGAFLGSMIGTALIGFVATKICEAAPVVARYLVEQVEQFGASAAAVAGSVSATFNQAWDEEAGFA